MCKKNCEGCYFYGDCSGRKICSGYTPITEEGEDFETQLIIRRGRKEFRKEWNDYTSYIHNPGSKENEHIDINLD